MNYFKLINKFDGLRKGLCFLAVLLLVACSDFHGPWEYTPEEREIYTGIYTYGYVVENRNAEICFSKVYELDETAAEDFAFYDSAYVTLQGRFSRPFLGEVDTTIVLYGENCFTHSGYEGIAGESYTMNAYFEWDSSGHRAKSRYKAVATIPNGVMIKGMNVPMRDGSYEWVDNENYVIGHGYGRSASFTVNFLEFPMDMEFYKCALEFDNTVGGVLSVLNYGMENGESVKTTFNQMFKGMTDADSSGYRGISMHDPLETQQNYGYTLNRWIAGFNNLDTLYLMNMMLPLGEVSVDLYATDRAYVDYVEKVKESVSDSRVVPESNIENGMGVFTGIAVSHVYLNVKGEGVNFSHVADYNCDNLEKSWDSRGCRLFQDVACAGWSNLHGYEDLISANAHAYEQYRDTVYNKDLKKCYASNVKAAMMLDTASWSIFLPDSMDEKEKSNAYADGLKRYCAASGFESNHIADCSELEKECLEDPEKNNCKEYLWNWCADRGWPEYDQCKSAIVSRYYLMNQKSSILHREVEEICSEFRLGDNEKLADGKVKVKLEFKTSICKNWCELDSSKERAECK